MAVTLATLKDLTDEQIEHRRDVLHYLITYYAKHEPQLEDHMSALRGFRSCGIALGISR
jgi:hypothetical protein